MSETHQTEKFEETDFQRTWRIKKSLKPLIDQHIKEMKKSAEDFTKSVNAMISKDGNPAVLEQLEDMFASAVEELQQGDYVLLVRSDDGDVLLREMIQSPEEAAPVSTNTEKCLENAKKTHAELAKRGMKAMEINKAESAEMVCLAGNYFRMKWRGGTTSLEDIRIPYKEYIAYITKQSKLLDNYPDKWDELLVNTLVWDAWIFTMHDGVLHTKPFSRGIKGWTSDMPIHPTVNQSEDLDLRRYAKKGF